MEISDSAPSLERRPAGEPRPRVVLTRQALLTIRAPPTRTPDDPPPPDGARAYLERLRRRHEAYAIMHGAAARRCAKLHHGYTVAIIVVSFVGLVATNILARATDSDHANLVNDIVYPLVAALTAINNMFGYHKRSEKHRGVRDEHRKIVDLAERAIAFAGEGPDTDYDFETLISEIQEAHATIRKTSVSLPQCIADMYPEYEGARMGGHQDTEV